MWLRRTVQSLLFIAVVAFGISDPWIAVWRQQLIASMIVAVGLIAVYEAVVHHTGHKAHDV